MSEFVHFQFETACLNFAGNEVVYGGVVTKVFYVSPLFEAGYPGAIRAGRYLVLKVRDNGEGEIAPPDLSSQYFYTSTVPFCNIFTPGHPVWLAPPPDGIGPMVNVVVGQIQVK
ncbi:MAG: hypothetical protein IPH12_19635 [Saprospirales bacterium]|nr:hypothetical protein [Saprospirales bacterium]MBK8921664.1 hypothetical protein [Saprospirales bacterium]